MDYGADWDALLGSAAPPAPAGMQVPASLQKQRDADKQHIYQDEFNSTTDPALRAELLKDAKNNGVQIDQGANWDALPTGAAAAPATPVAATTPAPAATPQPALPVNALTSTLAGAGTATGRGLLALQQLIGKGVSKVGDWTSGNTSNPSNPTTNNNLMQMVGGFMQDDAARGITSQAAENAPYQAAHPVANVGGQVAGTVLSPVNKLLPTFGAGSTLIGAAAGGAAQGAVLNAATSPVDPNSPDSFLEQKMKQGAVGAVGGGAGGAAGNLIASAINKGIAALGGVANRISTFASGGTDAAAENMLSKAMADNGVNPAALKASDPGLFAGLKGQVQDALNSGKNVDPAALARFTRAQTLPVPVPMLKGQVTRDPMQFAKEQNLRGIQGVGEPITQTLQDQNKALIANLDVMGAKGAPDIVSAGQTALDTLKAADQAAQARVSGAYNAFRQATGRDLDVPLTGLAQDYAKAVDTFGDAIPGAVQKQFNSLGLMSGTAQKTFSIGDAENLIKTINANFDPANRPAANALGQLRSAVQNAIQSGAGASADGTAAAGLAQAARQAAAQRFSVIDATPGLQAAINGVQPDKFIQKYIMSGNQAQVGSMMKIMQSQDPSAAAAVQNSVIRSIKEDALNDRTSSNGILSEAKLNSYVNDPNMAARLNQVLGPQKMDLLQRIHGVAEDALYAPKAAAVNTSNTTSAAANLVKGEVQGGSVNKLLSTLSGIPVIGRGAQMGQAAYQSSRANALVNESVGQPIGVAPGYSNVMNILMQHLNPALYGARAGAAIAGQSTR